MLRRLGSGIAALSIALLTTFAVVAFPSTAQALHNGTFSQQELKIVQGGVKAAAPRVAARAAVAGAVCGGTLGIGCVAIAVLGIGMLAYDTKEIWLPWIKEGLGEAGTDPTLPNSGGTSGYMNWIYPTEPHGVSGTSTSTQALNLAIRVTWTTGGGGGTANYLWTVVCKAPDGSTYTTTKTQGFAIPNTGVQPPIYQTITPGSTLWCAGGVGHTVVDASVRSHLIGGTPIHGVLEYHAATPVTSVETELVCQTPGGGTYSVKTVTEAPTDQVKVGHCAEGDTPLRVKTVPTVGGVPEPQWDVPLAPWDATSDQEYPLCSGGSCTYRIHVDGNPCAVGVEACTHWSYIFRQQPNRVECFYGPYGLDVANNCLFLERAYDLATGARTLTTANTDGNPDTYTAPAPLPARSPSASPTPTPTASVSSSPSPSSTPTTSAEPIPPGQPSPSPPADPAGARCFPQGWAMLNPFEWVYKPIMCAMKDAFVPNPSLTTSRLDTIRTKLETKGPGPAIAQVSALVSSVPAGGGCQGPGMSINLAGSSRTLYLFNACTEPMSTAAGYSYALATVVLVIGGGLSVVRAIASAFGLNVSLGRGARDGE